MTVHGTARGVSGLGRVLLGGVLWYMLRGIRPIQRHPYTEGACNRIYRGDKGAREPLLSVDLGGLSRGKKVLKKKVEKILKKVLTILEPRGIINKLTGTKENKKF